MDGLPETFTTEILAEQRTLRAPIGCVGIGLHSGRRVSLTLRPAAPDHGIVFRRTDLGTDVPARFDRVVDTRLCTVLAEGKARIGTTEHLLAAFAAAGVDNALVEIDGPEVPVFDGSAAPFLFLLDCAGAVAQPVPRRCIEVLRTVRVETADAYAELRPNRVAAFDAALSIAFDAEAIGRQALSLRLSEAVIRHELADARTFTLRSEIEALLAAGLARGGSLDNAVVVDGAAVLNPSGLRRPDEFVRHKLLDLVGDLRLAGAPLQARFIGHRSGHALNNQLLRALFADPSAWREAAPAWVAAPVSAAA